MPAKIKKAAVAQAVWDYIQRQSDKDKKYPTLDRDEFRSAIQQADVALAKQTIGGLWTRVKVEQWIIGGQDMTAPRIIVDRHALAVALIRDGVQKQTPPDIIAEAYQ